MPKSNPKPNKFANKSPQLRDSGFLVKQGGSDEIAHHYRRHFHQFLDYLTIDPMELELGVGLIRLADPNRGGDLLPRITSVRQQVASEIGIVLPKIRIRDNMRVGQYSVVFNDRTGTAGLSRSE